MKAKAPKWYTQIEMYEYLLRRKWHPDIARNLCKEYAENLQQAFEKGWDRGIAHQELRAGWKRKG